MESNNYNNDNGNARLFVGLRSAPVLDYSLSRLPNDVRVNYRVLVQDVYKDVVNYEHSPFNGHPFLSVVYFFVELGFYCKEAYWVFNRDGTVKSSLLGRYVSLLRACGLSEDSSCVSLLGKELLIGLSGVYNSRRGNYDIRVTKWLPVPVKPVGCRKKEKSIKSAVKFRKPAKQKKIDEILNNSNNNNGGVE